MILHLKLCRSHKALAGSSLIWESQVLIKSQRLKVMSLPQEIDFHNENSNYNNHSTSYVWTKLGVPSELSKRLLRIITTVGGCVEQWLFLRTKINN